MSQIALATAKVKTLQANATISAASNAAPIAVTTGTHGLETGDIVQISGVTGNLAANGQFIVTVTDSTHFTLNNSNGSGAYVSGGTAVHIGFATAGATVDNTVFANGIPSFVMVARLESQTSGNTTRLEFQDSGDANFVTAQPGPFFCKPGKIVPSADAKFSAKLEDFANVRMGASGNTLRLKVFMDGGPGAAIQFSGWLEY